MGSTPAPPGFLALTGHPIRWQVLNELAHSDRQVRELSALVGQKQSLTSYHLAQLREGGLVTMRRSSADKRDAYYNLDLQACRERLLEAGAALHPGLRLAPAPPASPAPRRNHRKIRVLFLCTGNSARSRVAEALLADVAGSWTSAASAGSHPKPVHANAIRVMAERGIDISGCRSKSVDEFAGQHFDHVISLCDRVREVCPEFPDQPAIRHWSIPDPATEGPANEDSYLAFVRTADDLTTRIQFFLEAVQHSLTTPKVV